MRPAASSDFVVPVEGLGDFVFGRRQMADEIKINVEYSRYLDGVQHPTPYLDAVATWLSTLRVLMVAAPERWRDLDGLDPLDEDVYAGLMRIHAALRQKEDSFRRRHGEARTSAGA